jgi:tetratricopeptide (TPR) repeat protein
LAWALWYGNNIEASVATANDGIATATERGLDPPVQALTALALVMTQDNDPIGASELIARAREAVLASGDPYDDFTVSLSSVWTHLASGDIEAAIAASERTLELAIPLERARMMVLETNASLPYRYSDPERALELTNTAVALGRQSEQHFWQFTSLAHRGFARLRLRDYSGALADFLEAMPHGTAVGDWRLVCSVAEAIAGQVAWAGRPRDATVLMAAAVAERGRRDTSSGTRADYEFRARSEERLRAELGADFDVAWEEGTSLPEGEVFDMAMRLAQELLDGGSLES